MMSLSHLEKKKVVSHNSNSHNKIKVKVTKENSLEKRLNKINNHSPKFPAKMSYHRVSNKIKITIRQAGSKNK